MTLEQIDHIRGYRVFRDFRWPSGLQDFGRYNLIYGWNGSGKTCLSSVFAALHRREAPDASEIQLHINGRAVSHREFPSATVPPIRVFNRDFVDRAVFEVPGTRLPSVFYFGESSADARRQIEQLKIELESLTASLEQNDRECGAATVAYERFCSDRARDIKHLLLGDQRFITYDAPRYKRAVSRLYELHEARLPLTDEERQTLLATANTPPMDRLRAVFPGVGDLGTLTGRVQKLLDERVLGSALHDLATDTSLASWVQQGMQLHDPRKGPLVCRFCTNSIAPNRWQQLEEHFSASLRKHQDAIDSLLAEIRKMKLAVTTQTLPEEGQLYPHLRARYVAERTSLAIQTTSLGYYLDALVRALESKRESPFTQPDIRSFAWPATNAEPTTLALVLSAIAEGVVSWGAVLGVSTLGRIVTLVESHNNDCDNHEALVTDTRNRIELDEVERSLAEWRAKLTMVEGARERLEALQRRRGSIMSEMERLEIDLRQHSTPAQELTQELTQYLGRAELSFQVEDNGYIVLRGREPAMHLSEGERTAIAFMYVLKSLRDTTFVLADGIVVIDDPVSSLDANALYCAFAYMKHSTRSAKQVFILTHDFQFFREVRNWFIYTNRRGHPRTARFYMLTCRYESGVRNAQIEQLDPLLMKYHSEYEYLYRCVSDCAALQGIVPLENLYGMPNIARRLLESFLAFKVPQHAGDLRQQCEAMSATAAPIRERILRFVNAHSHADDGPQQAHDLSLLAETPAILRDIVELMRSHDSLHADAMAEMCRSNTTN